MLCVVFRWPLLSMCCIFCMKDLMSEKERVFLLQCCQSGVHHSCRREQYPDWHLMTCPKCSCRTRVTAQVLRRDKFLPTNTDKIKSFSSSNTWWVAFPWRPRRSRGCALPSMSVGDWDGNKQQPMRFTNMHVCPLRVFWSSPRAENWRCFCFVCGTSSMSP